MRIIGAAVLSVCILSLLTGCEGSGDREFLAVSFKADTPLTYKMVSQRNIAINIDTPSKPDKKSSHEMSQKVELLMEYTPVKVDPFGLTAIKAKCLDAKVTLESFTVKGTLPPDAVESLKGKSFTFKVMPSGVILDDQEIQALIEELGKKAFLAENNKRGRIKNPDMIVDFIVLQWHLWDAIAGIENPLKGVALGQSWQVKQPVALPIAYPGARTTTYTLSEITETEQGRKATIEASYGLDDNPTMERPMPYSAPYRTKGTLFSVLMNYKLIELEGNGTDVFNIDSGTLQSSEQQYTLKMGASFILPLGDSVPTVTIDQKTKVQLVEN